MVVDGQELTRPDVYWAVRTVIKGAHFAVIPISWKS